DVLQYFRVGRLKEMGSNAYRTAHNPPTPELLDACDRLGMLVLDENRQVGTSPEAMGELREMVLRDRNHPSVFMWSVGTGEWGMAGRGVGARTRAAQRGTVRQLAPTRPVTAAISGGWGNGSSRSVDVMGFNYLSHGNVDDYHRGHPNQPSLATEEA